MTLNLVGRVAIVTGAAQGIGLATVRLLLEAGAKVHIAKNLKTCLSPPQVGLIDISPSLRDTCDKLAEEFNPSNILCLNCDVTDSTGLVRLYKLKILSFSCSA